MTAKKSSLPPLEAGVVAGEIPASALPNTPVVGPAQWGTLSSGNAVCFTAVKAELLPVGTKLTRVYGYPDGTSGQAGLGSEMGGWWTRTPLPANEAEWRAQYAVEAQWNNGQCQAGWTTAVPSYAWVGPAAPQPGYFLNGNPAPGYYLPGGAEQIYIDYSTTVGTFSLWWTPWDQPPPAPPVSTAAAPATPTVKTLTAAVGRLGTTLKAIAKEGASLNVDSGPLLFQAKQLAKIAGHLAKYNTRKTTGHLRAVVHRLKGIERHIPTNYPWSKQAATVKAALADVVAQAHAVHAMLPKPAAITGTGQE